MIDAYRAVQVNSRVPWRLDTEFQLPGVQCHGCGREWTDGTVQYPAIDLPFLKEKSFLKKRTMKAGEFRRLIARICKAAGGNMRIVPGASIGPLQGWTDQQPTEDFIWGSYMVPQISLRAVESLASEGIKLVTGECRVRRGRGLLHSYRALQLEPTPMLTEACLREANIDYCPTCGDFFQNYPKPEMGTRFKLMRGSWPKGHHLVMLAETFDIIASVEFMAAVKKHRLTGIRFEKYGEFVTSGTPVTRRIKAPEPPPPSIESLRAQCEEINRRNKFARVEFVIENEPEEPPANVNAPIREQAVKLAKLLGSKVKPHDVIVLGEPNCPFAVPLKLDHFKGDIFVGEDDHAVELKHCKREKALREDALFCVSFKSADRIMFTKDRVAAVSKKLGVPVYRQGFIDDETVAKYLLSDSVRAVLARVDFKPLTRFFLSPIQLQVSSKLNDPPACAAQVRVFIKLMEALACARKPEKLKRTDKR